MTSDRRSMFLHAWLTHFVPCFFVGGILLYLADGVMMGGFLRSLSDKTLLKDLNTATLNGVAVAFLTLLFHLRRNSRIERRAAVSRLPVIGRPLTYAVIVGFFGGAMDALLVLNTEGVLLLTAIVLSILIWNLRAFARHVAHMLNPGNVVTWDNVIELMRIYLTMLTGFSLVNAALEGVHLMTGRTPPFGFSTNGGYLFLDSLYYTVVTMTTLGFGDIVPKTGDAKLMLIGQCLVSYFMFALMIGIITRGVVRNGDAEKP